MPDDILQVGKENPTHEKNGTFIQTPLEKGAWGQS